MWSQMCSFTEGLIKQVNSRLRADFIAMALGMIMTVNHSGLVKGFRNKSDISQNNFRDKAGLLNKNIMGIRDDQLSFTAITLILGIKALAILEIRKNLP